MPNPGQTSVFIVKAARKLPVRFGGTPVSTCRSGTVFDFGFGYGEGCLIPDLGREFARGEEIHRGIGKIKHDARLGAFEGA